MAALDRRVGRRRRSAFIAAAVARALDDGALDDSAHEWDADVAGWVRVQRRHDPGRVG